METVEINQTTEEINERIAKNLIYYRKNAGLTQAELAALINYSDKSVSKWESAGGVPDIYILLKLAELYKITVDDLVYGEARKKQTEEEKSRARKLPSWTETLLMLLTSGIVWLLATIGFVTGNLFIAGKPWWLLFIGALPLNAILILVLSAVWKKKILNFISVSLLIWTALVCIYLNLRALIDGIGAIDKHNLWLLFLLGIPLQVLEIFWVFFRMALKSKRKLREAAAQEAAQENGEETAR
ncbi:MAG: helix-turn-helix transcriptional regulator [Clostridia bacterium]|nr:helix-turn-helix transcriptional regulator [Clostridia bacterium]